MIEEIKDKEVLDEINKEDPEDFNTVLNKKNLNKWELDKAFLGEI